MFFVKLANNSENATLKKKKKTTLKMLDNQANASAL